MYLAIRDAKHFIYITGWAVWADLLLLRERPLDKTGVWVCYLVCWSVGGCICLCMLRAGRRGRSPTAAEGDVTKPVCVFEQCACMWLYVFVGALCGRAGVCAGLYHLGDLFKKKTEEG